MTLAASYMTLCILWWEDLADFCHCFTTVTEVSLSLNLSSSTMPSGKPLRSILHEKHLIWATTNKLCQIVLFIAAKGEQKGLSVTCVSLVFPEIHWIHQYVTPPRRSPSREALSSHPMKQEFKHTVPLRIRAKSFTYISKTITSLNLLPQVRPGLIMKLSWLSVYRLLSDYAETPWANFRSQSKTQLKKHLDHLSPCA